MNRFVHRKISLVAVALAAAAATAAADTAPPPAPPPPPPVPTADIQLEVVDAAATRPSFSGALTLSSGSCGVLDDTGAQGHYHVRLCLDIRGPGTAPLVQIDVDRNVGQGPSSVQQKLQTTARVTPGARVVLGRVGQGTATTEIAATIH
jgi:hypothetical protein